MLWTRWQIQLRQEPLLWMECRWRSDHCQCASLCKFLQPPELGRHPHSQHFAQGCCYWLPHWQAHHPYRWLQMLTWFHLLGCQNLRCENRLIAQSPTTITTRRLQQILAICHHHSFLQIHKLFVFKPFASLQCTSSWVRSGILEIKWQAK